MKIQTTRIQIACAAAALTFATLPAAFAGDGASCGYDKSTKTADATPTADGEMQKVSLTVQGMSCAGCVDGVKKALTGVEGVKTASIDLESGKASVEVEEGKANIETLTAALKKAGYEAAAAAN